MAALDSKYHIKIDGYGFILARMPRADRHIYGREEAPSFVNKFSSGDPNYRDSTFFSHWVQNNWLNGFDQEKWNDGGKFYRSSGVDTTIQEKLTLQKRFFSAGQALAGKQVKCQEAWRASATSAFGDGSDGALTISADTTDAPIDSVCTGTSGASTLSATNASFAAGQIILIHQTQGTGAGTWQKNKITAYIAGTITLETALNTTYTTGAQVLVMKQYTNVTIDSAKTLTAKAWNGTVGGIISFLSNGTLTVTGTITATGKGFRLGLGDDGTRNGRQGEGETGNPQAESQSANGSGGGGGIGGSGGGTGGTAYQTIAALTSRFVFGGGGGGANRNTAGVEASGGAGGGIFFLYANTLTITGSVTANGNAGTNGTGESGGGGGGGGGCILLKSGTATLGSTLINATGGSGGTGGTGGDGGGGGAGSAVGSSGSAVNGGAGGTGRIHLDYATSFTGTTNPTLDSAIDSSLSSTPAGSNFTWYAGLTGGKIYSWNGASTWTEAFDTRRLQWYETVADGDTDYFIGDQAATERAQSQGFQLTTATKVKAVEVYIKKANGTPSDLQVRIETNNAGVPSGTLADANLTKTIAVASVGASYGWITVEFDSASTANLVASTLYHVVLKTAAAANDQNYNWKADASSPGYTSGARSHSADGGSTWTADSAADFLFRVMGEATDVNTVLVSSLSGTKKMYWGSGDPTGTSNSNARVYSFDGTTWVLVKTFNTTDESSVMAMVEFGQTTTKAYIGLGHTAKVYTTTDFTTFTLAKTISIPNNPGWVYDMVEYNQRLYVGGGYPQQLQGSSYQYNGFLYSWDEFSWTKISEFEHTVITSLEIFDSLLFVGTIKKRLYVYNTASMDKLFEFPWDVQITDMVKWDDKLAITIAPTPGSAATGNEGIYLFDRNGFHNAFAVTSRSWYSIRVFNNNLMGGEDNGTVYQTSSNTYQASGTLQTSYFEASLPSIDKLDRSLILHYEALPTGCTILAEYKTDESNASWTTIGTASTVDSLTTEFTFAVAFYTKKISIRLTLATTVSASTPTLKVQDLRYIVAPDFKYLWKMKLACPDNIMWLDGTEPISTTTAAVTAGQTTLALTDSSGFPTKGRGVLVDGSTEDEFTWTGNSGNTLSGIPATGDAALSAHTSTGYTVKITGKMMHKQLLTLKQAKTFYTLTDIDELTYTIFFNNYQADDFIVNQDDGLENNVPITLLEA